MTNQPVEAQHSVWNKRSTQTVEDIAPGVSRLWLHKGQIVCYAVSTVSRASIDAYCTAIEALVHEWPTDRLYLSIHDFSESTLTPYIRKRTAEANARMPKALKGRSAVIMPRTFINQAIRIFVTIDLVSKNKNIQRQVFFRLEDATEWLAKAL